MIYCCAILDFLRMWKSMVESSLDKIFSDILSSFKTCCSSLLRLIMAQQRIIFQIDEAFLFESFSSLKMSSFRYTTSYLQLLRKLMSNFSLFFLHFFNKNKYDKLYASGSSPNRN